MKKQILFFTILMFLAMISFGQEAELSMQTRSLLKQVKKLQKIEAKYAEKLAKISQQFPVEDVNGELFIGGMIKVSQDFDEKKLTDLGVEINSRINDIRTIKIPVSKIPEIARIEGIIYIQTDTRIKKKLNNARQETSLDNVHTGTGLSQAYLGEGVIIGVVDFGFDYTHPMFWNLQGNDMRISRVWNMTDNNGTPPSGFSYGSEIIGAKIIYDAGCSATDGSHGTHVAGIAGGSGYGTTGIYTGVAPASELVFVQMGGGESDVINAVNYIFSYAQAAGKPAVVNMSLGTHIGPHDGTSLNDQAFASLSGPGKILIGAAGNEGGTPMHASQTFPDPINQNNPETLVYFEQSQSNTGYGLLEIWGAPNTSITMAVNIIDALGNYVDYTDYYQSSSNPSAALNLSGVNVELEGEGTNYLNNRPHFIVYIENNDPGLFPTIELKDDYGVNNTIHIWNHGLGHGAPLTNNFPNIGIINGWMEGNVDYTVGEIGGTSPYVITVGAYTTKNSYTNFNGQMQIIPFYVDNGALAPFSSHGPTLDGRVKPEITAPGNVIVSSVNSFDNNYSPSNEEVVYQLTDGSNYWYFASMQGTSMATPFITGVTALMLQAKPSLNAASVKNIFKSVGRADGYTGTIPSSGSNSWGFGKIQAYNAVVGAIYYNNIQEDNSNALLLAYPNPTSDFTRISIYPLEDEAQISIFDNTGRELQTFSTDEDNFELNMSSYGSGLFYIKAQQGSYTESAKVMVK